jgi:hypothetical protein
MDRKAKKAYAATKRTIIVYMKQYSKAYTEHSGSSNQYLVVAPARFPLRLMGGASTAAP